MEVIRLMLGLHGGSFLREHLPVGGGRWGVTRFAGRNSNFRLIFDPMDRETLIQAIKGLVTADPRIEVAWLGGAT